MAQHTFDQVFQSGAFLIQIDTKALYGCFEHDTRGDECAGGLWFEGNELIDYDGVACLPRKVFEGLVNHGFIVSDDFK